LSLILPTYNERENLAPIVKRIGAALHGIQSDWEILVVDDSSPDGTARTAEELAKDYPIRVLSRYDKKGLARSVADGFRSGEGEFFLVMDADLSHPPERIPEMWDLISQDSCDLVIGSRYVQGGAIRDWTMLRRLTSRVSKLLVYPLTHVNDPLSGFFLVRKGVVNNGYLRPIGFKILLEILAKGDYRTVREVPITFEERLHGSSKLSYRVILQYLLQVVRLYAEKTISLLKPR
jgi:dolichol-phosphate mannosyltransferase